MVVREAICRKVSKTAIYIDSGNESKASHT